MFETVSDVFVAAAIKYLTAVDAEPSRSNQHEIGGLVKAGPGKCLGVGKDGKTRQFAAEMAYITDDDDVIISEGTVSWYDCRFHDAKRGPEWRLYYPSNEVTARIKQSDLMLFALTESRKVLLLFCPQDSQSEVHIRSIFGAIHQRVVDRLSPVELSKVRVEMPVRLLLAKYGLNIDVRDHQEADILAQLLDTFGSRFPATREFSKLARRLSQNASPIEDPDTTLIQWMADEERMFRIFERYLVQQHIDEGFDSVDDFLKISLSVQNRRKSRVGYAFENHIAEILDQHQVLYERGVVTELKKKPDFLFPGKPAYDDADFDASGLHILGAKTTCKERWRQVLSEAKRISPKHLITLEPSVSTAQTQEMRAENLQLVVPQPIQDSYQHEQIEWLISFKEFIGLVAKRF